MEKFDQYAHKEQYSLPRTAKLVLIDDGDFYSTSDLLNFITH